MTPAPITRDILQQKLIAWTSGVISAQELHNWVTDIQLEMPEFEDWEEEGDGRFSVSKEVLAELEMLDVNFVTLDDIPIFLDLLNTPTGGFGEAYIRFIARLQEINVPARMRALKTTEPYARHCK